MCTVFTINLNDANTDDEAVHSLVDRVLGLDVRFGIQLNEVYPLHITLEVPKATCMALDGLDAYSLVPNITGPNVFQTSTSRAP